MNLGYTVSTPIGDSSAYDLLVDINHKIYKIQCKTGKYTRTKLTIECTTNINTRTRLETHEYSKDDVDFFATYFNDMCYLIPFSETKKSFCIRFNCPMNNQSKGIHIASEYEAEAMVSKLS